MKKTLIALTIILSSNSYAVESIICRVSNSNQSPFLVAQGLNAVLKAKDKSGHLYLKLNPETVSKSTSHMILDGRYKGVKMNTHMSVRKQEENIHFTIRDTISGEKETFEFDSLTAMKGSLKTNDAEFNFFCKTIFIK